MKLSNRFAGFMWILSLVPAFVTTATWALTLEPPVFVEGTIWKLPGTSTDERWLEIHLIEGHGPDTVYHISILSKMKGDPAWKINHVVPHMAITDAALRSSSIRQALRERGSYPESYNEGYSQWLKLKTRGDAPICATSVVQCAFP